MVASTSHLGRAAELDIPSPPLPASELSTHCLVGVTLHLVDKHDHFFSSPSHIPISWQHRVGQGPGIIRQIKEQKQTRQSRKNA